MFPDLSANGQANIQTKCGNRNKSTGCKRSFPKVDIIVSQVYVHPGATHVYKPSYTSHGCLHAHIHAYFFGPYRGNPAATFEKVMMEH